MYVFVTILAIIVAILLALVVLVQNSKGGGLAANFAAQTQVMGVRKTADFLEKATWSLAVALLVLSLAATALVPKQSTIDTTKTDLNPNAIKTNVPAPQPAAQPTQSTALPVQQ
ncbi:MAG: preprotein translocase subunit SecG [Bacteroidales bacterium]|jgi:preprotein translocase subunit SecG|nr:preprotein translocase subunit SecG [Bacteroidales bacterium]